MPATMPCRIRREDYKQTCSVLDDRKTKYACIVEADELTRKRMEGPLYEGHEDHIAVKGINSLNHHNLVHKFIPTAQAMTTPDAKAAVDKERDKLQKKPAWQLTKVRNKKEVIAEAKKESQTAHTFCVSLMDVYLFKNSELEQKIQKYKGRVVHPRDSVKMIQALKGRVELRSDIEKDESSSYARFQEQGSSASKMTAAKVMGVIAKLPRCAGQAADAAPACTQDKNGRCTIVLNIPKSECPDIWILLPRHKWPQ